MSNNIRIALSGKKNVGKDSVKRLIVRHLSKKTKENYIKARRASSHGYTSYNDYESFATNSDAIANDLKKILQIIDPSLNNMILFGSSSNRNKECQFDGKKIHIRDLLKDISCLGKSYDELLWLKLVLNRIKNKETTYTNYKKRTNINIITDLRLQSEYNFFKDNNFFLIRIIGKSDSDSSLLETDLDSFDKKKFHFWIDNTSTKKQLKYQVEQMVDQILQVKMPHKLP